MAPSQQQALLWSHHSDCQVLYDDTPPEQLTSLVGIEQAVRSQMQKHVMLWSGFFLIETTTGTSAGYRRRLKSIRRSSAHHQWTSAKARIARVQSGMLAWDWGGCCLVSGQCRSDWLGQHTTPPQQYSPVLGMGMMAFRTLSLNSPQLPSGGRYWISFIWWKT